MGIHAWLLKRGQKYEVTEELHSWLKVYKNESERAANEHCNHLYISKPIAYRAIAPTGKQQLPGWKVISRKINWMNSEKNYHYI